MTNVSLGSSTYSENFDTLANTGTSSTLPTGFFLYETGTAANALYTAGTGSGNAGDTYSFGAAGSTDRALGTLLSSSLTSAIGAFFTNTTGTTITSLTITFTGEQWRLGTLNRADKLDFAYNLATSATATGADLAGTTGWVDFDALDVVAPITTGTLGALDGNANGVVYSATITGISIAAGGSFGIRWSDFNASGADDGLGIDNFSITANGGGAPAAPTVSIDSVSIVEGNMGASQLVFTVTRSDTSTAFSVNYATADGTAMTADSDYVAVSGTLNFAAGGPATQTISVTINGDTKIEPSETLSVALSGIANTTGTTTLGTATGTGTITNDDANITPIYTIQGSPATQNASGASSFVGQTVTTQGVVTARDTNGYYIQDTTGDGNAATSDAILVFTNAAPPANIVVGAVVQVTGTIAEFASTSNGAGAPSVTEITGSTATVISTGNALPAPVVITSVPNDLPGALAYFESLEGMRVTVPTPLVTGPTTTPGQIFTVANGGAGSGATSRGNLLVSAGAESLGNVDTVGGDFQPDRLVITSGLGTSVPNNLNLGAVLNDVTGILGQGYGYPEIQATQTVTVQTASPLMKTGTTLFGDTTHLLVASYNAENLDPGDGTARFATIAGEIINQLNAPGIIAMQEVQDNNGATNDSVTSASTTLQLLVDAIKTAGGPQYAFIDNTFITDDKNGGEPGGNIRVAYLYRTDTVSLVPDSLRTIAADGSAIADTGTAAGNAAANADQATNVNNPFNGSRPPLAAEFIFLANGEHVTLVNNHFTSKGGSDFTTGTIQPPLNAGEVQRAAQAQAVNTFVDGILAGNANARVIVTGDLNEYEFEEPLTVLKGNATLTNYQGAGQGTATYMRGGTAVLEDLQDSLPVNQRYDYVFQGVSQTLDHLLATTALTAPGFLFQPVHINSEFFNQTSDHDPLTALFTITDTMAPLLVQTSPIDDATGVAPGANIVLTFSEPVKAGTGNIILDAATGADVTIAITDASQVTISGNVVTINPAADLRPGIAYDVIIGSGVITDASGNAFAGIARDALDFTTSTGAIIPAGTFASSFVAADPASYTLLGNTARTQTAATGVSVTATTGITAIDIEGTLTGPSATTNNAAARAINIATGVPGVQITVGTMGVVQTTNADAIRSQSVNGRIDVTNLGQMLSLSNNAAPSVGGTNIGTGYGLQFNAVAGATNAPTNDFVSGGIVTNGSASITTALIRSDSGDAVRLGSHQTLVNYGTINGNGPVNDASSNNVFNPAGGNTSVAQTYGASRGVRLDQDAAVATRIENYGMITGAQHGIDVGGAGSTGIVVINAANASIVGRNGSGVGADTTGVAAATVTVDNSGTITGGYAPTFDRAGYATIDGDGDGIDIDGGATIINRAGATISGTGAGGFDAGGRANNAEGISIGGGIITNDGSIIGAARGIVVNNDGVATRSGVAATMLTNDATGTITGQNGFAIRFENKNGNATDKDVILNYGRITGTGAIPDPAVVVTLQNGAVDTNSSGTLNGMTYTGTGSARFIRGDGAAVQTGEGADSLVNYGTITGSNGRAISLEGGDDMLTLYSGGTISGRIDGGAGNDMLTVRIDDRSGGDARGANSGSTSGMLASIVNIESLAVAGGAWTIADAQSYTTGISIASGATLTIGAAGSLTGAIVNQGALIAMRDGDLTLASAIQGAGALTQAGSGILTLSGANSYTGGTTLISGTLEVAAANAAGTNTIAFTAGVQTLRIDQAALGTDTAHTFTNTLSNFSTDGDTIDFAGIANAAARFDAGTNRLSLYSTASNSILATVQLSGSYAGLSFVTSADGMGGTQVTLTTTPNPPPTPTPTPTPSPTPTTGASGDDQLVAISPTATLVGGAGNDTYLVTSSANVVVEASGEGYDTVYTTTSYAIGNASIEFLSPAEQAGTAPINLSGNYLTQTIAGNFGDNVLNAGSAGADTLIGLFGNDTYIIADASAVIIEEDGQGTDTVFSSVSYALNGSAYIEVLSAQNQQGIDPINLTGNGYAQQVVGNFGNNLLNGNGGADTLIGLKGDDIYAIADTNAVIVENPGEGNDIVYSSVSYALTGAAEIETLSTTTQRGTENINLIGNQYSQQVVGNFGNNVLNGNGGIDTLIGLKGDDNYVVGNAAAQVIENGGEGFDTVYASVSYTLGAGQSIEVLSTQTQGDTEAINLTGNELAQTVIGNYGANVIDGGAGADTLIGLAGADTFHFSTAPGNGTVDTIADFGNGADRISLSASVFGGMASGALSASNFVVGSAATTADQHIVYNQTTGQLFYDADGSGASAAVLFATVTPGTVITADMITVA